MSVRVLTTTNATLLLEANPLRKKVKIQMQAVDVDANNTGAVFIATGRQPVATVGHPGQGDILLQASAIEEPSGGAKIDNRWKEQVWAVADTVNQSITVEEELEDVPVAEEPNA